MSLTEQELDEFLDEVNLLSDEKLETILETRERPRLLLPPSRAPQKNRLVLFGFAGGGFLVGLAIGLAFTIPNRHEVGQQLTYIIQKISELENSKDLIEPLSIPKDKVF